MTTRNTEVHGYLLVLLSALCFGTLGIIGRMIYAYESDPLTVVTFRASLAAIILFVSLLLVKPKLLRLTTRDVPFFVLYGFLSVSCNYLTFFYAIKYTTIATATVLLFTYPALVSIFSIVILGERFTRQKFISLLLTFVGTLLVIQCYNPELFTLNLKGILFGIGTSVCISIYTLYGKKATQHYDSWTIVFYSMSFGAFFLIVFRISQAPLHFGYPWQAWGWIAMVALIPTLLAYSLYTRSFHYLEAGKASIVASLEVVTAPVMAFLVLGETLTIPQIFGAGLVIWGIILIQKKQSGVKNYERAPTESVH